MIDSKTSAAGRSASLADLLDAIEMVPQADCDITGVTSDSREVSPGMLFVAVPGVAVDGHKYIPQAVAAGAAAVVCQYADAVPAGTPAFEVADSREALGRLASRFYGDPSDELKLVGVTGTNGKTTTATLLYEIARLRGHKAGLISTVANIVDTDSEPAEHTTPDPVKLNALLRRMADAGCSHVFMEVSSHAADQHRIAGLTFAGGIFTNLTRDHLDYHRTFDNYLRAKKSFFDGLGPDAFALSNADDRNGAVMLQNTAARKAFYSVCQPADFTVKLIEDRLDGMLIEIGGRQVETRFTGRFNASNLAAVYGAAVLLGATPDDAMVALSALRPVAGRFQTFRNTDGVTAIVDYAHTPDALENVLDTIAEIVDESVRVITVCGAGGDRDRGKRPMMARSAADRSDFVILTSDNPRSEDPAAIIAEMTAGLNAAQLERTECIVDRAEAIRRAAALARPGDVILVAGKGHETSQVIGTTEYFFDDRIEVCKALNIKD